MATSPASGIAERIHQALVAGKSPENVVQDLVTGGLSRPTAERFVARALAQQSRTPARTLATPSEPPEPTEDAGGRGALVSGAFWFSLGSTVTLATYLLAAPGQRFTVAYGAVVAGLFAFGRGIKRWSEVSQPFPWLAVLAAMAVPPIGATALVGVSSWRQHDRQEARRATEEKRLDAARAVQEDATAVKERKAADDSRVQRHAERVARARGQLQDSSHAMTLCEAALDLGHAGAREAIPDLIALLSRPMESASVRNCAADALTTLGEADRALAFYVECARAGTSELRGFALMGFRSIGPPAAEVALPYLSEAMQSPDSSQRYLAVEALANLGRAAEPLLRGATQDAEQRVRERALQALASITP